MKLLVLLLHDKLVKFFSHIDPIFASKFNFISTPHDIGAAPPRGVTVMPRSETSFLFPATPSTFILPFDEFTLSSPCAIVRSKINPLLGVPLASLSRLVKLVSKVRMYSLKRFDILAALL